jgi:hypothetical protein
MLGDGTPSPPLPATQASNGKSPIVEERLYSFFFDLFNNKKTNLLFFLFFTITNEDVRFASILYNFKRFHFAVFFLKFLE